MKKLLILLLFIIKSLSLLGNELPVYHTDIHLMVTDLIDEYVYQLSIKSPINTSRPAIITQINMPAEIPYLKEVALQRLYETINNHPSTNLKLTYCSICQKTLYLSTKDKTTVTKVADQKEFLESLGKVYPEAVGLSLTFSVEKEELILQADLFELKKDLPVILKRYYQTNQTIPRLLRNSKRLISVDEAKNEYLQVLKHQQPYEFQFGVHMRQFLPGKDLARFNLGELMKDIIFPEFKLGLDSRVDKNNKYRVGGGGNFVLIPNLFNGYGFYLNYRQRVFPDHSSLILPEIWWYSAYSYTRLSGTGLITDKWAELLSKIPTSENPNTAIFLATMLSKIKNPSLSINSLQTGVDIHVRSLFVIYSYIEFSPTFRGNEVKFDKDAMYKRLEDSTQSEEDKAKLDKAVNEFKGMDIFKPFGWTIGLGFHL